MLQPDLIGLLGQSVLSFIILFIPSSKKENLPFLFYTAGPSDASASRTKLRVLGLKACAIGPTVSNGKKIEMMGGEERRGEGKGGRGEERLQQWANTDRVPY